MRVFVFPYETRSTAILSHLVSSPPDEESTVLFVFPEPAQGDRRISSTVAGFKVLVNVLAQRGPEVRFKGVQVSASDFPGAVRQIALSINEMEPNYLILDLSEGLPILCLETYAAAAAYASTLTTEQRARIRVLGEAPGSGQTLDLFLLLSPARRFVPLLREVDRYPGAKLRDLQEKLSRHASTLSRQLRRAEGAGLVKRVERGYRVAEFGKLMLELFEKREQSASLRLGRRLTGYEAAGASNGY